MHSIYNSGPWIIWMKAGITSFFHQMTHQFLPTFYIRYYSVPFLNLHHHCHVYFRKQKYFGGCNRMIVLKVRKQIPIYVRMRVQVSTKESMAYWSRGSILCLYLVSLQARKTGYWMYCTIFIPLFFKLCGLLYGTLFIAYCIHYTGLHYVFLRTLCFLESQQKCG